MLVFSDSIFPKYNHSKVENLTILYLDIGKTFDKVPRVLVVIEL